MIKEAIHALIIADSDITDLLATFEFTTGVSSPAVFTTDVIPSDAENPAIRIDAQGGPSWGSWGQGGGESTGVVEVFGDKETNANDLLVIARKIKELLYRNEISVTGYEDAGLYADEPIKFTDPEGYPGYRVPYRSNYLKDA